MPTTPDTHVPQTEMQIGDHRLSSSCGVVERPDHQCGDDLVCFLLGLGSRCYSTGSLLRSLSASLCIVVLWPNGANRPKPILCRAIEVGIGMWGTRFRLVPFSIPYRSTVTPHPNVMGCRIRGRGQNLKLGQTAALLTGIGKSWLGSQLVQIPTR